MVKRGGAAMPLAILVLIGGPAHGQEPASVPAPSFKPGDGWLFDETVERGASGFSETRYDLKVERVDEDTMVVGIKRDGAPSDFQDHVDGLDWSLRHLVDGREEATARPYDFPLVVGKTWTADYTDAQRHGLQTSAHYHWTYKVVGFEDITVPAGTFHAIKIEAKGVFQGQMAAGSGAVAGVSGSDQDKTALVHSQSIPAHTDYASLHSVFDYSPGMKVAVKTVEEVYNSDDVRIRLTTRSLVSIKPAS